MEEEIFITGSALLSLQNCERQAWLTMNKFLPEKENPYIVIGKFIHEHSYTGSGTKEIELPGAKIDVIWKDRKVNVVGEIKKSSRSIKGATVQLLFYLKLLKDRGIEANGVILVPKEHKRIELLLTLENEIELEKAIEKLRLIAQLEIPPEPSWKGICTKCGFGEFCWS